MTTIQIKVLRILLQLNIRQKGILFEDLTEGFRFIKSNRQVLYLAGMALIILVLGHPYQQVSVPLLALDVLNIGRSGAGWMLALIGIGALIGSLTLASIERLRRRGLVLMAFIVIFGLALILLSQSTCSPICVGAYSGRRMGTPI